MFAEKNSTITAYSYDPITKELLGSFEYFWAIGTGLAANSTQLQPLESKQGFAVIYDEESATWSYIEDLRGTKVFSTSTQQESEIDYIGPIKEGFTTMKPTSIFETWTGETWADQRTAEEIEAERLKQFTPLTRYQFFRALLENGYKSTDIEAQIQTIADEYQRELVMLGWQSATSFVRTDESVLLMQNMLGWTDEQVEQMWTYAMTL